MKQIIPFVIGITLSAASYCQSVFEAFPKQNSDKYHVDFSIFYKSLTDVEKDRKKLDRQLEQFNSFKGKTTTSAKNLITTLRLQDSISVLYIHLWAYYDLHVSVNRTDYESRNMLDELNAKVEQKTIFFDKELAGLSGKRFDEFKKQLPSLSKYSYYYNNISRKRNHTLTDIQEQSALPFVSLSSGWQFDLYEKIKRSISFSELNAKDGKLNVFTNQAAIESNADSVIRAEGFKKLYEGYNSRRSLFAFALIQLAKAEDQKAKLYGFPEASESYYFEKFYSKDQINRLFKQIIDSAELYKYYQRIRRDFAKKRIFPTGELHYWDMKVSVNNLVPRFSIDSATEIILKSMRPQGLEYETQLSLLLNPRNGRMEIAPSKTKRSGGFSRGFIGTTSVFYSGNYRGFYDDVRVITHEATHAIHRELMNQNHVLPVYAGGPNYLFESFSIFSEFLLSDYLIENSKTPQEKQFYLEKYFEGKGMALFSVASDALLEQTIHEGAVAGSINNEDDLDSVNAVINKKFSIWPVTEYPQLNQRWITNGLFYEDPFYDINYVLGALLALKYYDLYKTDRPAFQKAYIALLKNGFTEEPATLLMKFLKIDINSPGLLSNAISVIRTKVMELEKLYNPEK
ncbi:MAG TPA: M3 family metallopeptidase [Chitinophagaceae bacterium]|nr:M3 family metallopeptidase [Chitinophagaceae bacterium]